MLRAQKHLTKKEMKKDPLFVFVAQASEYLQREWIKIGSVILGTLLVVVVAVLIVHFSRISDRNAYDSTMKAYYSNAPESIDVMTQYVTKHSGSKNATKVMLQLANFYLTQKNFDAAEKFYRMGIDNSSEDQIFAFNSYNGLGAVLEERSNFEQAGQTYETYIQKFPDSAFTESMRFSAGKAYFLAGNKISAERNFRAVLESDRDSELKQEARYYIELISS
jgi:predicted negative regulator of RcsB-dependent stress response